MIVLQEETQQIQRKDNFFLQNVKHISESIFNDVLNFQCDEDKLSQGTRIYINLYWLQTGQDREGKIGLYPSS